MFVFVVVFFVYSFEIAQFPNGILCVAVGEMFLPTCFHELSVVAIREASRN